ncbi:MAG TPA: PEP/pyruvate-binding domain-containing protein [Bacteroidales bacterium]|nr:PEP/pyruvate-binding domain-containing protein [Bacteroidales bacterium]
MKETDKLSRILADSKERLKELACINTATAIIKEKKSIEETCKHIALILPQAFMFPENAFAEINYNNKKYLSSNFEETEWKLCQSFETIDEINGEIIVYYNQKFPKSYEGPFLKEERDLLVNISNIITGYINSQIAKKVINVEFEEKKPSESQVIFSQDSHKLMSRFISKQNSDRDIYHDLMPFKVKEILLVANLYDAYIIEKEGRFLEHILGEYYQLNLSSTPRITGISDNSDALELLKNKHFDLVIIMLGIDKKNSFELSRQIKANLPYIPVYMLLNNNNDIAIFEEKPTLLENIDKQFVWNGDSKIFFTMIKHLEDLINVENDTNIGMVRVILLVEDSAKYYSRYLPVLYQVILEQTKDIIEETNVDELYKVLKLRARPKILLARTYEEALSIYEKYREYLLCVISDVSYPKAGEMCNDAGIKLITYIKKDKSDLPVVLQSSDTENAKYAYQLNANFINKNSETLAHDIKSFIRHYLGFGNFIYRDSGGKQLTIAKTLREFEQILEEIPEESLIYHGQRNHFSQWLMARGEIHIARNILVYKTTDFITVEEFRQFLIRTINRHRNEQNKGKVIPFEEQAITDEKNIVSLTSGAMGGKGRGIAFINTLIHQFELNKHFPDINITTPKTSIIGTDEFDYFIERNKLRDIITEEKNYEILKIAFINSELSSGLKKRLKMLLQKINNPLAIRSSSLFEDSLMQPFSGIFATYLLPNNDPDINIRLEQILNAIKLVYASIYSDSARTYFEAIHYKIEEEKMAIVVQEVVGNKYGDYFYPHISGTAQSHNFYPVAHMKPEEGFAVLAVGLGTYVVEGERTFRFSPKYPTIEINSQKDIYKSSQVEFYAVNLNNPNINLIEGEDAGLIRLDISTAKEHGTIKHCASIYDFDNERIVAGIDSVGPIVINFANILSYNYIPLAETISKILDVIKEAMGSPVEIEFAVDLNKDENSKASFYLLQIKPLVGNDEDFNIDLENINYSKAILFTEKSMGNGLVDNITDMVYIDPDVFDNCKTQEIAKEVEYMNDKLMKANKKYVLIGPGRWGTRDPFIGIPVVWPQICNAKIIVETSLQDFPLDASLGSHFFHNVTSMNVGYFTVQHSGSNDFIKWDILKGQQIIEDLKFVRHIQFEKPLNVIMDGKKRIAVISLYDE